MDAHENVALHFAEDLMFYLTKRKKLQWQPRTSDSGYRRNSEWFEFNWKIGKAVFRILNRNFKSREVPHEPFSCMQEAKCKLYDKFFESGHEFVNMLEYCGQLVFYGMHFYRRSDPLALDTCVSAIAMAIAESISRFMYSDDRDGEQDYSDYWQGLRKTAEVMDLPKLPPVYRMLMKLLYPRQDMAF